MGWSAKALCKRWALNQTLKTRQNLDRFGRGSTNHRIELPHFTPGFLAINYCWIASHSFCVIKMEAVNGNSFFFNQLKKKPLSIQTFCQYAFLNSSLTLSTVLGYSLSTWVQTSKLKIDNYLLQNLFSKPRLSNYFFWCQCVKVLQGKWDQTILQSSLIHDK